MTATSKRASTFGGEKQETTMETAFVITAFIGWGGKGIADTDGGKVIEGILRLAAIVLGVMLVNR